MCMTKNQSYSLRLTQTDVPQLLDLPVVRARLAMSKATVDRLISKGQLRSLKIGRRRYVDARDLAAFVEQARSGDVA